MGLIGVDVLEFTGAETETAWKMRLSDPKDPASNVVIEPDSFPGDTFVDPPKPLPRVAMDMRDEDSHGLANAFAKGLKVGKVPAKILTPADGTAFLVAVLARFPSGSRVFARPVLSEQGGAGRKTSRKAPGASARRIKWVVEPDIIRCGHGLEFCHADVRRGGLAVAYIEGFDWKREPEGAVTVRIVDGQAVPRGLGIARAAWGRIVEETREAVAQAMAVRPKHGQKIGKVTVHLNC
jgi:hypothetical protein